MVRGYFCAVFMRKYLILSGSIYTLLLIVLAGQRTLLAASINEFAYTLADVLRDPGGMYT